MVSILQTIQTFSQIDITCPLPVILLFVREQIQFYYLIMDFRIKNVFRYELQLMSFYLPLCTESFNSDSLNHLRTIIFFTINIALET